MVYDVVIVGAGVAGMTAAIYARRANKAVLVIESKTYGGQIITTSKIANWPGEPGISGIDLSKKIYQQMKDLGAEVEFDEVESIQDLGEIKEIKCKDVNYSARTVILAVGSKDREMGVPGEKELAGARVSYCATCDGAFYKDKTVAIVGGGNTAFYDALYLADIAKKVYLVHRRDEFRADAALVEKVRAKKNVEFVLKALPVRILGDKKVEGLVVNDGEERELLVDGIFVAVGRAPATKNFAGLIEMDENGYVVTDENCRTSCGGVFAAGDCRVKTLRQLVTAAGDGAIAANEAIRYLR